MIPIKGRGVTYGEVWFNEEPPADARVEIVFYRQRPMPAPDGHCIPFLSLVTDLSVAEDEIFAGFGKNCHYKFRHADTKDGLHMEFIPNPENRVEEFRQFYDAFANQQSSPSCYHQWLVAAGEARQLVLTCASRDGNLLIWHAYVSSGKNAGLLYTGSHFRNRESEYRALIGWANRWLHWREMLQFKKLGVERFDWDGLSQEGAVPEHAGINRFKEDFGGRRESTYHCMVPVTIRGRLFLAVRDTWWRPFFFVRLSGRRSGSETRVLERVPPLRAPIVCLLEIGDD